MEKEIPIKDYWYNLPPDRIALYPLEERDQSKLLVYRHGQIEHSSFKHLTSYLPDNSSLFFNNTRVIPARIHFQKETGAIIELFLLNPISPSTLVQQAMEAKHSCRWICTIGNLKKWIDDTTLIRDIDGIILRANLLNRQTGEVEFTWDPAELSFAQLINKVGVTPLPPYLKRDAEESDRIRYQTVYSNQDGAVAAPTAGLHFTETTFKALKAKGHTIEFLTLHVSAGTFQPVKVENAVNHPMHAEQVVVTDENLEALINARFVIAVGTTSMRTIESLYWYGIKVLHDSTAAFTISQFDPYRTSTKISAKEALKAVRDKMKRENLAAIAGETSIMIMPGYNFKIVQGLITNFHQPASTLMLLVAAFIGEDWKRIYQEALQNNYRFLSYGDSSLLLP